MILQNKCLYEFEPIISVENFGEEETIDIEVEDVHAFHAINPKSNNFASVSHNSAHITVMDISHPDIEEFITYKQGDTNKKLTSFNISVGISQSFIDAVKNDSDWDLVFEGKVYKTLRARDLMRTLAQHAFIHNEPGMLIYPEIDKRNFGWYAGEIGEIRACNPCGEQPLPIYGVCNLSSINLSQFIKDPFTGKASFDWADFRNIVNIAVRFSDNVVGAMEYPLPPIKDLQMKSRRIGVGITGLANAMSMLGMQYGDENSIKFASEIGYNLRNFSLQASARLAKEKGAYPLFNKHLWMQTPMAEKMNNDSRILVEKYGLRNISLNTIAPVGTGSIAMGLNCSSGIEPTFSLQYDRKVRIGDEGETYTETIYDYAYLVAKDLGVTPDIKTAEDIDPYDAMKVQAALQEWLDSAISKTYNLPTTYTYEDYEKLVFTAFDMGLVGFTSYNPNGSLAPILSVKKEGSKDERPTEFLQHSAPKRPKDTPCDIYVITVKGKKYLLLVGLYDGKPYEIFATEANGNETLARRHPTGIIRKVKKGHYRLLSADGETTLVDNVGEHFNDEYEPLGRLLSTSLRHGTPVEYAVQAVGDTTVFGTWGKMVSVVLKKYIKDGVVKKSLECPECGCKKLEYKEGCMQCTQCSWSKCG